MIWLKAWGAHALAALIALERLFERLEPIWNKINKRRNTTMGTILSYLSAAKYVIPVIDALVADIKAILPTEKADVAQSVADFEKAFGDAKNAFAKLVSDVKAAIANA